MQRAAQGPVYDFRPVENSLWEEVLPAHFIIAEAHMPGRPIIGLTVNHKDMDITDPTLTA